MTCQSDLLRHVISKRALLMSAAFVGLLGISLCSYTTYAFVKLNYQSGGMTWSGNAPQIPFTLRRAGSDNIADASEEAAIRLAFQTWSEVDGSGVVFYEDLGPNRDRPSSDFFDNNLHMITFDESNETGFFGSVSSGLVAITPVEFVGNQIVDADIIFNGRDFNFSTHAVDNGGNTFDVQAVATHEIGHFVGLDHSPVWGSTMVPFTFAGSKTQRSLQQDDIAGAVSLYPVASGTGSVTGIWQTASGQPIIAGHVVAVDQDGIPQSTSLTANDGRFTIAGLPFGSYTVYVEPLDGPVTQTNLFQAAAPTLDFTTTFAGGNNSAIEFFVAAGNQVDLQTQTALPNPSGAKVNITTLNQGNMALGNIGRSLAISFGGTGLTPDKTLIIGSGNGDVEVTSAVFQGSLVTATLFVNAFAKPGLRCVVVRNAAGDNVGILTGGFEVARPAPSISSIAPVEGSTSGGTSVEINGEDFEQGSKVVFGDVVSQAVQFASQNRLVATAPARTAGAVPLTVIHPNGQSAKYNSFTYVGSTTPAPTPDPTSPPPSNSQPASSDGGGGGGGGGGCSTDGGPASPLSWLPVIGLLLLPLVRRLRRVAVR